jgi:hypothetical protein
MNGHSFLYISRLTVKIKINSLSSFQTRLSAVTCSNRNSRVTLIADQPVPFVGSHNIT